MNKFLLFYLRIIIFILKPLFLSFSIALLFSPTLSNYSNSFSFPSQIIKLSTKPYIKFHYHFLLLFLINLLIYLFLIFISLLFLISFPNPLSSILTNNLNSSFTSLIHSTSNLNILFLSSKSTFIHSLFRQNSFPRLKNLVFPSASSTSKNNQKNYFKI
jgi:hypothetical protein